MLVSFYDFVTTQTYMRRGNLNWRMVSTRLASGHVCGALTSFISDCYGSCHPWADGPGLCERGTWASEASKPEKAALLQCLCLQIPPGAPGLASLLTDHKLETEINPFLPTMVLVIHSVLPQQQNTTNTLLQNRKREKNFLDNIN